jgi:hypothetical protein
MVLQLPETLQLSLGGSADSMAELPQQVFALTLGDDVIEDMIESVRKGHQIEFSLGDTPVSLAVVSNPSLSCLLLGSAVEVKSR